MAALYCLILVGFYGLFGAARCQFVEVDVAPGYGTNPQGDSTAYTRYVSMNADNTFHVKWDFDENKEHMTFTIYAMTHGWVGFGFSSNGGMPGSDIMIGWVKDGEVFMGDRHATDKAMPVLDTEQNYELVEGYENDTHTVISFRRKIETCDPEDRKILMGTNRLIYAWNPEDPTSETDIAYHGPDNRGTKSVFLSPDVPPKPLIPDDIIHMDFTITKFNVPSKDTTYWCQAFKIPKLDRKHHAIKLEPLIQKGNEGFVHHMVLYTCHGTISEEFDNYAEECISPNMPEPLSGCNQIAFNWGVGGGDFYWPEKAGMSIWGGPDDPNFFFIEMHYDNPGMKSGLVDASGLRLILTPTVREFDSAVINHGHRYDRPYQVLPPYFPRLTQYAHCPGECIREEDTGKDGIYIFANLMHLHLTGISMRFRHYRDGKEQAIIDDEEQYDFNLQEMRPFSPEIHVLPGDTLVSECIYTTAHRTNITVGGLSTSEEMCQNIFMYYPKMPLALCESYSDMDWVLERLSGVNLRDDEDNFPHMFVKEGPRKDQSFLEVILAEDWKDPTRRAEYQRLMDRAPILVNCAHSGGNSTHTASLLPNMCVEKYRSPDKCGNKDPFVPRCEAYSTGDTEIIRGSVIITLAVGILALLY